MSRSLSHLVVGLGLKFLDLCSLHQAWVQSPFQRNVPDSRTQGQPNISSTKPPHITPTATTSPRPPRILQDGLNPFTCPTGWSQSTHFSILHVRNVGASVQTSQNSLLKSSTPTHLRYIETFMQLRSLRPVPGCFLPRHSGKAHLSHSQVLCGHRPMKLLCTQQRGSLRGNISEGRNEGSAR